MLLMFSHSQSNHCYSLYYYCLSHLSFAVIDHSSISNSLCLSLRLVDSLTQHVLYVHSICTHCRSWGTKGRNEIKHNLKDTHYRKSRYIKYWCQCTSQHVNILGAQWEITLTQVNIIKKSFMRRWHISWFLETKQRLDNINGSVSRLYGKTN